MNLDLTTLSLTAGSHDHPDDGMCLMEAVAYFAGERHSDKPICVSPALGAFGRRLNDILPHDKRQWLRPLIPFLVGTANDGMNILRAHLAMDWIVRTYVPKWLDLAGFTAQAEEIRSLQRIGDPFTAQAVMSRMRSATEARRAWDPAAVDTASLAAVDAAMSATRAAAVDAAVDAAMSANRDAATRAAAVDAAMSATRDAAVYAARRAAVDTALRAAVDTAVNATREVAVWAAAWEAATAKLAPTVSELQDSAIDLFVQMIAPGE